jgi:glutamate-1-semialdehyde 2,1-aminomutase
VTGLRPPRSGSALELGVSGLYEEALRVMPGGVNSPVRSMAAIGRDPIFIERGEGAELVDTDGNRYVDWVCSWGPLIAGHAHPDVVDAVTRAAERGTSYGAPTKAETELAEQIIERMPSVEMVRLVNSGTEASMSALRVARAATGRDRIVKFAGHYHGHVDGLLVQAGSGLATAGLPASRGVTPVQAGDTAVARWNDRASVEALLDQSVAAVICEPLPANMGVVPAEDGFLEFLREATERVEALLILDEVISGFRCQLERPSADLVVMGKVIGGGLPLAAYGGRAELMREVAPAGDVYQAGTLSGNPLATAAGLATLRLLDSEAYARVRGTSERLATGMAELDERVSVVWRQGVLTPFFRSEPPRNYDDAMECEVEAYGAFARGLLERGVYPPASQFEAWFPSLVHTDEHVEQTLEAAKAALSEL